MELALCQNEGTVPRTQEPDRKKNCLGIVPWQSRSVVPLRLLIVEDEQAFADSLRRGLVRESYAVDVAHDAHEASGLYEANAYDLLILDLGLPDIDGLEVFSAARAEQPGLLVLILTARAAVEDRVRRLDSGGRRGHRAKRLRSHGTVAVGSGWFGDGGSGRTGPDGGFVILFDGLSTLSMILPSPALIS